MEKKKEGEEFEKQRQDKTCDAKTQGSWNEILLFLKYSPNCIESNRAERGVDARRSSL